VPFPRNRPSLTAVSVFFDSSSETCRRFTSPIAITSNMALTAPTSCVCNSVRRRDTATGSTGTLALYSEKIQALATGVTQGRVRTAVASEIEQIAHIFFKFRPNALTVREEKNATIRRKARHPKSCAVFTFLGSFSLAVVGSYTAPIN